MLSRVWTVAALVQAVGDTLQARYGAVAVQAELGSWTLASSGHAYFTLKDARGQSSLRCVMFRRAVMQMQTLPREGQMLQAQGQLSIYEARGELQLVVDSLTLAGAGALYEQFLQLKAKLAAEGWFDAERKRALPPYPRRIAVITSSSGAAVADVLSTLERRSPHVEVWVLPCLVQGAQAPEQLVEALQSLVLLPDIDAAILCRGGGSIEDLWAFNDERVVKAVATCAVPVVCGVGHETDVTLADLAADLRAPTPTAAAELISPAKDQLTAELMHWQMQLQQALQRRLDRWTQRLDRSEWQLNAAKRRVSELGPRLNQLQTRLASALMHRLAMEKANHQHWCARLEAIAPHKVLSRGYAWVSDEAGQPLMTVSRIQPKQRIHVHLVDGSLAAQVQQIDRMDVTDGTAPTMQD